MNINNYYLILEEIRKLGQEAFSTYEELMRWRETSLDSIEKTKLSTKHQTALEKQRQWINFLQDLLEIEDCKPLKND